MGEVIGAQRRAKGLTQRQLADRLGVTDKAVSKWERGNGYPDINYLKPLAAALELDVSDLLAGKPADSEQSLAAGQDEAPAISAGPAKAAQEADAPPVHKPRRILLFGFGALCLLGILTTAIVDGALHKGFTWSLVPISAILFAWLCITPLLLFPKRGLDLSLLAVSVLVFPFLALLSRLTGGGWFVALGLPMAGAGVVFLWLMRFVFATRLCIWDKVGAVLWMGAAFHLVIDWILGGLLENGGIDVWTVLTSALLGAAGVLFFAVHRFRRRQAVCR